MPAWVAALVAVCSTIVAVVAAVFSRRQVAEARKARKAAEAQVTIAQRAVETAQRAADAAERSARAEESAAALAVRQAHDAAAPKFEKGCKGSTPCFHIYLSMIEGPPLSEVIVRPQGRNADRVEGFTTTRFGERPTPTWELGPVRKGEGHTVFVHTRGVRYSMTVAVDVYCVPAEPGVEPWLVHETLKLVPPRPVAHPITPQVPRNAEDADGVFRDRERPF